MNPEGISFNINDYPVYRNKMLNWVNQFNIFCFLDNHQYKHTHASFECMLAAGDNGSIEMQAGNAFPAMKDFYDEHGGWLFGHFGYEMKNETLQNKETTHPGNGFADMHFFIPQTVIKLTHQQLIIYTDGDANDIRNEIESCSPFIKRFECEDRIINSRMSREQYLLTIARLKQHIHRGDCYEINYCQEFFSEGIELDPLSLYDRLQKESPNPFASFYKVNKDYCMCASPERFLSKEGTRIISQPIKGTSKRELLNEEKDNQNRNYLLSSSKERSENVMIVDLVRNDISQICKEGSVKVDELFGVYSFPQVHQMISTISGELKEGIHWVDIIKAVFPIGSMTGAPKMRVMELIEQYEQSRRGLFSGAIGYIQPGGDFDFNVVIRSMFYNESSHHLSFQAGSGITDLSDPENEYAECLLKVAAMQKVLSN